MSNRNLTRTPEDSMWRGALLPSLIIAALCVAGSIAVKGRAGAWGSILACLTVVIFFSVHLAVSALSRRLDPITTMALAMFSYFAKVAVMGALLIVITKFTSPATVSHPAFGATALAITAAWLTGEIRAFLKLRLALPLPSQSTDKP